VGLDDPDRRNAWTSMAGDFERQPGAYDDKHTGKNIAEGHVTGAGEDPIAAKIPGNDPANSDRSACGSSEPMAPWPMPATRVRGTACAISEPTIRAIGIRGYRRKRAVTQIAPAPTDEKVTRMPSTAPIAIVSRTVERSSSLQGVVHSAPKYGPGR
jgi:hypothetical protein